MLKFWNYPLNSRLFFPQCRYILIFFPWARCDYFTDSVTGF